MNSEGKEKWAEGVSEGLQGGEVSAYSIFAFNLEIHVYYAFLL